MIRLLSYLEDKHLMELVKGSVGALIVKVIGIGLSYAFMYLAIQWYGAYVLGIYSLSVVALRIALLYGKVGLDNAMVRFVAAYAAKDRRELAKQVYFRGIGAAISFSLGISVLLFFGAPVLAHHVFKNPHLITSLRIIAFVILPGTLLHLNAAVLRGLKRIKSYSFLLNAAQFLLGCVVLLLGKSLLEKTTAPVTAYAIATAAAAFISFGFGGMGESAKKKQSQREEAIRTWPLLKVAFPMLLTGSYSFLLDQTGTIALGVFRSEVDVGIFTVVLKVAGFLTFTLHSINSIAASKFSECYSTGDMEGFRQITRYSTRLISWTTVPIGLVFLVFPRPIIGFFGEEIKSGTTALIILVVGYFVNALSGSVGTILNMTGHQVVYQNIVLAAALVNITLNILLIPRLGINGAAIANTVSMMIWNISSVIYIYKKFNILTLYIPFRDRLKKEV
ncbi:MAG: flippase [Candidatus Aminicenantes bacterium]|nr:MAG: flippase [Candidatus Aminicenantes bacterium]